MEFELQKLGLTKGESKVYLSLLKLGNSKVGKVVKESGVSYSKVYDILDRLAQKGLVSTSLQKNVRHYQAVEPYRLKEFIEKKEAEVLDQKQTLKKIMKDLVSLASSQERSRAEVFLGVQGLRTASEVLLNEKEKVLRFFYPEPNEQASTFYKRLYPKFKAKGMQLRGIGSTKYRPKRLLLPSHVKIRFVDYPVPGTIDVIADKVLIISWEGQITSVMIHSKEVANYFKTYFDGVWAQAKK